MKKWFAVLSVLLLIICPGCKKTAKEKFTGTVLTIQNDTLLVRPEDTSVMGEEISVLFDGIDLSGINPGDKVEIEYSKNIDTNKSSRISGVSVKVLENTETTEFELDENSLPEDLIERTGTQTNPDTSTTGTTSETTVNTSGLKPMPTRKIQKVASKGQLFDIGVMVNSPDTVIAKSHQDYEIFIEKYKIDRTRAKYDEKFFEDKMLIMIAFSDVTDAKQHKFKEVELSEQIADIIVSRSVPKKPDFNDMKSLAVIAEISKTDIKYARLVLTID